MLALLLASVAGAGLVAWHMQRRAPPPVKLSFARLLPEPPVSETAERRFALTVPLGSVAFWLRMLALLAALGALMVDMNRGGAVGGQGIGLRIVLDVTHSMGLPQDGVTRLDAARSVAEAALVQASAGGQSVCTELVLAGASAGAPGAVSGLSDAAVRPEGGGVAALVAAAAGPVAECPLTHVLVLTDARKPALDWTPDGPVLLWHQIGEPVANTGLRSVSFTPPGLGSDRAKIDLVVAGFGEVPAPVLWLDGPGGRTSVTLLPSPDRDQVWLGEARPNGAGSYIAVLEAGGAYGGDDRLAFALPEVEGLALDWRLAALAVPRGALRSGVDGLLVVDLADVGPEEWARPLLAVYPGWPNGGQVGRIGAFVQDSALLAAINLDAFELNAPRPMSGPLPPGFTPVLTDTAGGVYIARRSAPPGLIVPAPLRDGGEVQALSLTLFFTALADLAGRGTLLPAMEWRDAQGQVIEGAALESDTARALDAAPPLSLISPRATPAQDVPVWPLLALIALVTLMAERALMLWRGVRHAV